MERETALPEAQLEVMEVIWDHGGSVMFADLSSELGARGEERMEGKYHSDAFGASGRAGYGIRV